MLVSPFSVKTQLLEWCQPSAYARIRQMISDSKYLAIIDEYVVKRKERGPVDFKISRYSVVYGTFNDFSAVHLQLRGLVTSGYRIVHRARQGSARSLQVADSFDLPAIKSEQLLPRSKEAWL